jgi:hypothetical protein
MPLLLLSAFISLLTSNAKYLLDHAYAKFSNIYITSVAFINENARLPPPSFVFDNGDLHAANKKTLALLSCLQTAGLLQYFALNILCPSVLCLPVNNDDLNFFPGFPIPYQYTFVYQHLKRKEQTYYSKFH